MCVSYLAKRRKFPKNAAEKENTAEKKEDRSETKVQRLLRCPHCNVPVTQVARPTRLGTIAQVINRENVDEAESEKVLTLAASVSFARKVQRL